MRRRLVPALALALALLAAGCSTSPCQELGEKLCACTGLASSTCKTQVEEQLKAVDVSQGRCDAYLATCQAPAGATFCEWLRTADGKVACGLAEAPAP